MIALTESWSLESDPIRLALCTTEPNDKYRKLVKLTADAFLVVINRQAKDYLEEEGALYELPPEQFI